MDVFLDFDLVLPVFLDSLFPDFVLRTLLLFLDFFFFLLLALPFPFRPRSDDSSSPSSSPSSSDADCSSSSAPESPTLSVDNELDDPELLSPRLTLSPVSPLVPSIELSLSPALDTDVDPDVVELVDDIHEIEDMMSLRLASLASFI